MGDEWRAELRGASYRGDGNEVVALLEQEPLERAGLQVAGDAIRIALVAGAEGADALATTCAAELRRRDALGDGRLAEHLDALTGRGPVPLLRPLDVRLEDLAEVLEGDPMEGDGRIDRTTGEVWHPAQVAYAFEIGDLDPEDDDPDRWLFVDREGSRRGFRDMEAFASSVDDLRLSEQLAAALDGRRPFRRFKDVLSAYPGELERWFSFTEDRRLGRARDWLADHGYRPTDPPDRSGTST